ncbi:MAG TPA: hypothetical protein VMS22_03290 [Candidatus Eisenbacteria bacterium]|nr:hypothetical protein [Candidatus Eisenbacteria bacterium]
MLRIMVAALAVLGFVAGARAASLDAFARCLRDRGATFYGASWCPQCAKQRRLFGTSERFLRYVECADEGGDQTAACGRAGITGYPTWEFADGTRVAGRLSLEQLGQRAGCKLPD